MMHVRRKKSKNHFKRLQMTCRGVTVAHSLSNEQLGTQQDKEGTNGL